MGAQSERLRGKSKEYFEIVLEELGEGTRRQYLSKFLEFLSWADLDSETLLAQHRASLKKDKPEDRKKIPFLVYKFQKYRIDEKGDKVASSRLIVKVIRKFFEYPELPFNMNSFKIRVKDESQAVKEIPIITKVQLLRVLGVCGSIRVTAIIHTAKESGLRISDVCNIKMEHVRPILDGADWHTFEILPRKNLHQDQPLWANPVIGPEGAEAIRMWARHRKEMGIDSPYLFTSVKNVEAHTDKLGRENKAAKKGGPLKPSNASVLFRQLRDKAGLGESKVSIHSLRKYHKTNLEYGGCPTSWINRMQGRKGEGTGGTYSKPDSKMIIEVYSGAYHGLELTEIPKVDPDEFEDLKQKNEALNSRLDEMEERFKAALELAQRAVREGTEKES